LELLGPHWDERKQVLYHVDAFVGDICQLTPKTGHTECHNFKKLTTIIIPIGGETNSDAYLVSLQNKLIKYNWSSKTSEELAECAPERHGKERFNDGKVDAKGRLWIGTVVHGDGEGAGPVKHAGSLWKFEGSTRVFTKMSSGFTIANGMAWSADSSKLYFNDSEDRKIYVFDFNLEKGTLGERKVLVDVATSRDFHGGEYPDGMTIDVKGKLWVALYGGSSVVQIDVHTGRVLNRIAIPAPQTTSVFFGGEKFDELYVTCGFGGLNEPDKIKYKDAGKVFKVTCSSGQDCGSFRGAGAGNRFKLQ
jgi:gluconolactonase